MDKIQERLPAIPGRELERVAAGLCQFVATVINAPNQFADDERIACYMHVAHVLSDLTKYVCRNYIEQPDVVELHASLGILRGMLHARGLVRADGDDRGLEPCS
jgi:hypothetical protein